MQILDTALTVLACAAVAITSGGLIAMTFCQSGWRSLWEAPKQFIIDHLYIGLIMGSFFLIVGLLPFGLGKLLVFILNLTSH